MWNLRKVNSESQCRLVVPRAWGGWERWEDVVKGYKLPVMSSGHLRYMVTIVNNTVLYT